MNVKNHADIRVIMVRRCYSGLFYMLFYVVGKCSRFMAPLPSPEISLSDGHLIQAAVSINRELISARKMQSLDL